MLSSPIPGDSTVPELEADLTADEGADRLSGSDMPAIDVALQTQHNMSPSSAWRCSILLRGVEVLCGVMAALIGVISALALSCAVVVAIVPGLIVKAIVMGLMKLFVTLGASQDAVDAFFNGSDDPDQLPESGNRHTMRITEMKRGEGLWENYKYYVCNTHPILAIFLQEDGHPFAPFERVGTFVLICAWGYFTTLHHWLFMSRELFDWKEVFFNTEIPAGRLLFAAFFLSLPGAVLLYLLTYLALADYTMNLQRGMYSEMMSDEREMRFVESFVGTLRSVAGARKSAVKLDVSALKKDRLGCAGERWFELVAWTYSTAAQLFGYTCWLVSGVLIYYALQEDHEGFYWHDICHVLVSVFVNWFPISYMCFFVFWHMEHAHGFYNPLYSRRASLGIPFLGPTEPEAELLNVFDRIDLDQSGELSQDEVLKFCTHAFPRLNSEDIMKEIVSKLDKDADNTVTPNEFLVLLPMYCQSTGWYHRSVKKVEDVPEENKKGE